MSMNTLKISFSFYLGRSLGTVCMSFVFSILIGLILYFLQAIVWLAVDILIFVLDCLVFIRIFWWIRFAGKGTDVFGYLRWDKTIEIHIANVKSPLEFQRRIRKTIKYAREKGYLIEFTSGILTYGEIIDRYGEAVVSLKPLSLFGRIFNASVTTKYNPTYNVTHPLKVVLDPKKL